MSVRFRTELTPPRYPFILSPSRPVVMLGSCFADNMASMLRECGWNALNPFGTLFNPVSISMALRLALEPENGSFLQTLFHTEESWRSWAFGSVMAAESAEEVIAKFDRAKSALADSLSAAEALFVTFGTAWVYALRDRQPEYVVGNCHKQPDRLFERRRLSVDEIVREWKETVRLLRVRFPDLEILFTVSPVRHLKDGFHGNTVSKSILHLAAESLCEECGETWYFPAYELLTDDLRDYRFYADDLVHPSPAAIQYIRDAFMESFLDEKGRDAVRLGEKRFRASRHIPLDQRTSDFSLNEKFSDSKSVITLSSS